VAGSPGMPGPAWQPAFNLSRRLPPAADAATFSSFFANPFRSAGGATSVLPTTSTTSPAPILSPIREVDVTLLRAATPGAAAPLLNSISANAYNHTDRNAYFRYQALQKTSNSITTRSNVYATWITIGYFEIDRSTGADTLGQELGSDTGDIKRHRAFYIYDRSIPVGFELGRDHNYERGILVKRFIE
jgi:hypothetical protein